VEGFRQMVIKRQGNAVVTLADVATVELGAQSYDSLQLSNGHPSITIAISPTPDGNPLEIVKRVKALLPQIQRAAPPGLTIASKYDIAFFVNASIEEVIRTLIEAILIVVVVIFLFLGSFRAVVIPVITIPLSLIGTAALMLAGGFSLNLLTLLAMVLATGLVVDDAIVVVENIHRHIEEGLSPIQAALVGAREIFSPVIAMTLTLAAVYTPIGLMGGLTGALFREFAFTLAGSVVVSGVIALTLSPMMSSWLLHDRVSEGRLAKAIEHRISQLTAAYGRCLDMTLAARPAVLLVGAGVLGAIIVLFNGAQRELSPPEDTGTIYLQTKAPQYANAEYGARAAHEAQRLMSTTPEFVSSWFGTGGDSMGSGSGGINLRNWNERSRSAAQIQAELNARGAAVTDVRVSAYQGSALPAASSGLPVQMVIRSPEDFPSLYGSMEHIKGAARASGLFAYVDSDLAFDSPEARLTIDRAKAGELGVSMDEIAGTLAILVGENYITRFNWHDRSYDVIAQAPRAARATPEELGHFYVKSASGALLPLDTVVHISMRPEANQLPQFNQMNSATLSAILAPGVTMGRAVEFLKSQPLAPGATLDWLGESRQYVTEGDRLTFSFLYALVVIFLVLAAQFESFRDPLVILVTVPLAVCGALVPLYLQYATLNIYTQIGLVTLIGLISKHGILMVSFANQLQHEQGLNRIQAIRRAAEVRMRPVLMTTAAMVAGLVPLIFASGAGASSRFAIGIVVATGMLVGTLFTLFVLPTMYSFIARDHRAAAESPRRRELATTQTTTV
jgi:multidrug efflux pump